jgi:serine/threonine protein kinase
MAVIVRCPNPACGKAASVAEELLGRTARCPSCGGRFTLSQSSEVPDPSASQSGASAAATGTAIPQAIGRYQVRRRLGSGAFGAVYHAYDPQLDRDVALKVPHPGLLTNARAIDRFLREARSAAKLRHPHIVPVYDAGQEGDFSFIASAFIPGRTLEDVVDEGPAEFRQAARWAMDLAEALAEAHANQIIHRDVKPANVLIDERGRVLLTDFGLAYHRDVGPTLTQAGTILGTPGYIPPELATGKSGEALPTSDQYSLGVVLYELLGGRKPFEGPSHVVLYHVLQSQPDPLRALRADVPPALEAICLKAMAKRPKDRYPSCQEFADDLRHWLDGAPVRALAAPPSASDASSEAPPGGFDFTSLKTADPEPILPPKPPAPPPSAGRPRGPALLVGGLVLLAPAIASPSADRSTSGRAR